jgi:hypothetical protein
MNHQHRQQQESEGFGQDLKRSTNFLLAAALVWSYPMTAWMRRAGTCGSRYFGNGYAVLGMVFWPVFCILVAGANPDPLQPDGASIALWAWAMTLIALFAHRVRHAQLVRGGYKCHSLFTGVSWMPGDYVKAKGIWEPAILFAAGALTLAISVPLGIYFIGSAVGQSLIVAYHQEQDRARARQIEDARIEAEYYAELTKKREN